MLCLLKSPWALLMIVEATAVLTDDQEELHNILFILSLCICGRSLELSLHVGQALPDDKHVHVLFFSSSWSICFLAAVMSCCQRYTSPGSTLLTPGAGVGYPQIVRIGRLSSLIAFAMSGPSVYSF
jgi:hypothetical protein